jgi:hypothetical protein
MMCVKAELISTRLLSKDDKEGLLDGSISEEALMTHVKVWKANGMHDLVGCHEGQTPVSGKQGQKTFQGYGLVPPFVRCSEIIEAKELKHGKETK